MDQLCWHPAKRDVFASASEDKTVIIWDARGKYDWIIHLVSLGVEITVIGYLKFTCVYKTLH